MDTLVQASPAAAADRHHHRYLLAVVVAMGLLLWAVAGEEFWDWLLSKPVSVQLDAQVYLVPERQLERMARTRPAWLSDVEAQALERLEQGVGEDLQALFDHVHGRVPDFADWYYSPSGAALRLFAAIPYPRNKGDRLAQAVSDRLFPLHAWQGELDALDRAVAGRYSAEFVTLERTWLTWLAQELAPYPRDTAGRGESETINLNQRLRAQVAEALDGDRIGMQVGAGLGAGTLLARAAVARVNARVAAGRAAARVAGRSTAAGSSAACGVTGPAAFGCGVLVFTTVTIATEWGLLKTDEALNRPALEQALGESVDALHAAMRDDYGAQLMTSFEAGLGTLSAGVQSSLRPIDRLRLAPERAPAAPAQSSTGAAEWQVTISGATTPRRHCVSGSVG